MNIKILLRTAVAAALLSFGAGLTSAPAMAATPEHPNILVIMADDQDDMNSIREMPELKQLVAKGVHFTNSFADFPLCCPSRASFLTGQSSHNSGIQGNKAPDGGWEVFKNNEGSNIGVWLQAAGYRTAIMGKLMNGYGDGDDTERMHVMPGWNEWDVLANQNGGYRYYGYTLNENGTLVRYGSQAYDYQTDVIAAKGDAFIRSSGDQPFFLLLQPIAPHGTHGDEDADEGKGFPEAARRDEGVFDTLKFRVTGNFNEDITDKPEAFQRMAAGQTLDQGHLEASFRRRREAMLAFDDMIKREITALTETGKLDNTYIVITSDNGYSLGSHKWQGKTVLYDESIRIPLVIAGPGVPKGEVRDQLVNNLDVVATILGWAGATPARTLDGRSLQPVMEDTATPWRDAILIENKHVKGVRTKDWMYAESLTFLYHNEQEIYNLTDDAQQLNNRIRNKHYQPQVDALKPILDTLRTCVGDSCWYDGAVPAAGRTAP